MTVDSLHFDTVFIKHHYSSFPHLFYDFSFFLFTDYLVSPVFKHFMFVDLTKFVCLLPYLLFGLPYECMLIKSACLNLVGWRWGPIFFSCLTKILFADFQLLASLPPQKLLWYTKDKPLNKTSASSTWTQKYIHIKSKL